MNKIISYIKALSVFIIVSNQISNYYLVSTQFKRGNEIH